MPKDIAVIILAAGESKRMGQAKQLLKIGGESLIRNTIILAQKINPIAIQVVLGANKELIEAEIKDLECNIVYNRNWKKGMGSSLVTALKNLLESANTPDAILMLLVDQPFISLAHLRALVRTYQSNTSPIIATQYNQILAVPAIFDKSLFKELLELKGDRGARKIIAHHKNKLLAIPFSKASLDIDTPEDFKKAQILFNKK
ncbi:MAG TPA: nucleotidyltransferase family protein [Saprospiraceae bacterium]|nr:nucleotidyltransferase family protein [Saprospiraceae bacterium]